jgi:hypothetical protein
VRCLSVILIVLAGAASPASVAAQFIEAFDSGDLSGWTWFTGDGEAVMDFVAGDTTASIRVDASADNRNVWWALVKRDVTASLDLARLAGEGAELRIQARIRVSHAPRRVNLHLNTQRTTDFHSHLMEIDIADTLGWHTISMTTRGFDAAPGDTVYGQLALMDWGFGRYRVDLDEFRVDVVDPATAGPDHGAAVPYHPPVADPDSFAYRSAVAEDGMVDLGHPGVTVEDWYVVGDGRRERGLRADEDRVAILRWDLGEFAGRRVRGSGLLELTTLSASSAEGGSGESGLLRVTEILGGDPDWTGATVTLRSFTAGRPLGAVLNPQMIIDVPVTERRGGRTLVTISEPVLQRLVDGRTRGLALRPLGAMRAAFFTRDYYGGVAAARLYFNLEPES